MPDSELDVAASDGVSEIRLPVRLRLVWLFGPVSRVGRSRHRAGDLPPTQVVVRKAHDLFGLVKTLSE